MQDNVEDVTGDLTDLETTDKSNLVGAINEAQTKINTKFDKTSVKDTYSTSTTDTYSCNYVNGLETYSTSETRVGTWIDGKPIYRKVLELTTPSTTSEATITTLTGVSTLTDIKGFVVNDVYARVNYPYYFNNGNYGVLFYRTNTGEIVCSNLYTGYHNRPITVTIEYTKTTD